MRTVIEYRKRLAMVMIVLAVAFIVFGIAVLFYDLVGPPYDRVRSLFVVFGGILIVISVYFHTRSGKEMIVLDDAGLTLNGDVMLGPIPWDCVLDVRIRRILFDKTLEVELTNLPVLRDTFEKNDFGKICRDKKAGRSFVSMDLDLCKLRGIDLVSLIKMHAKGIRLSEDRDV